jgi:hypothetical protein
MTVHQQFTRRHTKVLLCALLGFGVFGLGWWTGEYHESEASFWMFWLGLGTGFVCFFILPNLVCRCPRCRKFIITTAEGAPRVTIPHYCQNCGADLKSLEADNRTA